MKNCSYKLFNKLGLCITLLTMTICLSGCVKFDTSINIDKNGNVDIEDTAMMSNEALNFVGARISKRVKEINSVGNPNLKAEKVQNSRQAGVKVTYHVDNIAKNKIDKEQLTALQYYSSNHISGNLIEVNKHFFYTNYDIDCIVDFSVDPINGAVDTSWLEFLESQLTIKIPVKAKEHNAYQVDDKNHIYTWEYDPATPENEIKLNYSILNTANIIIAVLTTLILIGALFYFVYVAFKKHNNGNAGVVLNDNE